MRRHPLHPLRFTDIEKCISPVAVLRQRYAVHALCPLRSINDTWRVRCAHYARPTVKDAHRAHPSRKEKTMRCMNALYTLVPAEGVYRAYCSHYASSTVKGALHSLMCLGNDTQCMHCAHYG